VEKLLPTQLRKVEEPSLYERKIRGKGKLRGGEKKSLWSYLKSLRGKTIEREQGEGNLWQVLIKLEVLREKW